MHTQGLFSYLADYKKKDIYPFHMPGHKQNKNFFKDIDFLSLDLTEFGEMDNLHSPEGIILNSSRRLANIYKSDSAYFLVNGTTSGILASLLTAVSENEKIIISRNCHKSVYDGLRLTGARPVYIYPEKTKENILGSISPKKLEKIIQENMDAKAIFITNPTYDGICSDISAISQIAKRYSKPLIVDEAHGAHFPFSDIFPKSSAAYADITITSLHKTLPCLGQSSALFLNSDILDKSKLTKNISAVTTTSPSYILMGIMDYFFEIFYPSHKKYFDEYTDLLIKYIKIFNKLTNITLFEKNSENTESVFDFDITKLLYIIKDDKMKPAELSKIFSEKYKLQLEYSGFNYFLALSTVCDTEEGFKRLEKALTESDKELSGKARNIFADLPEARPVLSLKEAFNHNRILVPLKESLGKISAGQIIPYPPGIPLLNPGEIITKEVLEVFEAYEHEGINILGQGDFKSIEIADL